MENPKRKLDPRAFVALVTALSGLGLPLSGIANHLHGFEPLTVERHAWMTAHNALGMLFVVFSIWHVVLNRRALWRHLRLAAARVPGLSREALLASALVIGFLLLSLGHALHTGG